MKLSMVSPFSRPEHRRRVVEYAQLAEAQGYHSVWIPEAFSSEAFTLLGAIAASTRRVKLATGIVNVFSRTPSLLAQAFATLDEISDGRAIIGLGTSGPIVVQDWHGMKFEKPVTRTREVVEIIRMALAGERVNYDGQIFKLKGFQMLIKPVQKRIPVYLATFKPNAVKQTGEIGDGWLPTHASIKHFGRMKQALVDGAKGVGRDPAEIDAAPLTLVACSADGDTARLLCAQHLAYYVGGMGTFYGELMHDFGYGEMADRIQALWKAGDRDGATRAIPREILDDLVIAGTEAECRAAIEARARIGIEHIVAFPPHGISPEQLHYTLKTVAPS
jgi:F420-dependent oxidoreductase-like protein